MYNISPDNLKQLLQPHLDHLFHNRLDITAPLIEQLFPSVKTLFSKINGFLFERYINRVRLEATVPASQAAELSLYNILEKATKYLGDATPIAIHYNKLHFTIMGLIGTLFSSTPEIAERTRMDLNLLLATARYSGNLHELSFPIQQFFNTSHALPAPLMLPPVPFPVPPPLHNAVPPGLSSEEHAAELLVGLLQYRPYQPPVAPPTVHISSNQCSVCRKFFCSSAAAAAHLITHTNEQPHECENGCGKRFNVKSNCTRHENESCPFRGR